MLSVRQVAENDCLKRVQCCLVRRSALIGKPFLGQHDRLVFRSCQAFSEDCFSERPLNENPDTISLPELIAESNIDTQVPTEQACEPEY